MNTTNQLFIEFLKQTGETAYGVSKKTEIPINTLDRWKHNAMEPKISSLEKIFDHYDFDLEIKIKEKK